MKNDYLKKVLFELENIYENLKSNKDNKIIDLDFIKNL